MCIRDRLYYQVSGIQSGAGWENSVVTNERCLQLCTLWGNHDPNRGCVAVEYRMWDGNSGNKCGNGQDGGGASPNGCYQADSYHRCELWVYPRDAGSGTAQSGFGVFDINGGAFCSAACIDPSNPATCIPGGSHHNRVDLADETLRPTQPWPWVPNPPGRRLLEESADALVHRRGRKLATDQENACNLLQQRVGGLHGVSDACFVSYYDLSRHNDETYTRDQRRATTDAITNEWVDSYMCVLVPPPPSPAPPPPPEPYWVATLFVTTLTSAVTADATMPGGTLRDTVNAVVQSVVPSALVTLTATAYVAGLGRRLSEITNVYACGTNCADASTCFTGPLTQMSYEIAIVGTVFGAAAVSYTHLRAHET